MFGTKAVPAWKLAPCVHFRLIFFLTVSDSVEITVANKVVIQNLVNKVLIQN